MPAQHDYSSARQQGPASGGKFSKLIVTDYFGYDHWRSPWSHGSCEQFNGVNQSGNMASLGLLVPGG